MNDEGRPVRGASVEPSGDEWSHRFAALLDVIPREDQDARPLMQLCHEAGVPNDYASGFGRAAVASLTVFGVVSILDAPDGDLLIKAATRLSMYFIRSLAAHIREGRNILYDWSRHANPDGSPHPADMLKGPQFLIEIERERNLLAKGRAIHPLRETHVSQLIIKARVWTLGACYLMEYDPVARMFQPIGGHRRGDDADSAETMLREIAEELPMNVFDFRRRDRLQFIADVDTVLISRTVGVNTLYHFSFYLARLGLKRLRIDPTIDRWIPQKDVLSGRTRNGIVIATEWLKDLEERMPGGISALPCSLDNAQRATLKQVLRERRWEVAGLIIGIIGIIVSIVIPFA